MSENLKIWDALSKTDPNHTKSFSRSGGFKGTAIKPIWIVKMLTDQFGPVGVGWGMDAPSFQVVEGGGETLVYCTVRAWHTKPENGFYGVGGDKVVAKRQSGAFCDDEAFKKAFTDAVGNAFKFAGVGADVHMGQFDDSKYVNDLKREFAGQPEPQRQAPRAAPRQVAPVDAAAEAASVLDELETIATQFPGRSESFHMLVQQLRACQTTQAYKSWEDKNLAVIGKLGGDEVSLMRTEADAQKKAIRNMNQLAA